MLNSALLSENPEKYVRSLGMASEMIDSCKRTKRECFCNKNNDLTIHENPFMVVDMS